MQQQCGSPNKNLLNGSSANSIGHCPKYGQLPVTQTSPISMGGFQGRVNRFGQLQLLQPMQQPLQRGNNSEHALEISERTGLGKVSSDVMRELLAGLMICIDE
jgi:hypothetical protein